MQSSSINKINKSSLRKYRLFGQQNKAFNIKKFSELALLNETRALKREQFLASPGYKTKKLLTPIALDFYFTYYFQHSFKIESNVLYKNLVKQFFSNKTLKKEHKQILFSTKYLQKYN